MSELSRRRFLQAGAASATAVALGAQAAGAATVSQLRDIDHFIIVMQENRSFDQYFGMLRGVRGFSDPAAATLPDGQPIFQQPDAKNPDGYVLPFRLNTFTTSAQTMRDLGHEWITQHAIFNGGKMDRWVPMQRNAARDAGPLTMGYFTRDDLPFHYALADEFTICDAYHCSVLGPTYPNRIYHWSASGDAQGLLGGPVTNNIAGDGKITYRWETYPERLERAGISWQTSFVTDDYGLNVLKYFAPFKGAAPHSVWRKKGLTGRPLGAFLNDVRTGNIPQVTWVFPQAEQCEHPRYMPAAGAEYLHSILGALWSNPKLWARTAVIVNYDENDGQFDHVLPPTPDPGTPDEFIDGKPIGLGFRVPCFVISPFSRGGYVCSETFDHTSVLRLLEARFGVEVPNLSAWRRATAGDLTSAFGFGAAPDLSIPEMPDTAAFLAAVKRALPTLPPPAVPTAQGMPVQEPGTRPRRPAG